MTPFLPIIFTFKKTKNQQFLPPLRRSKTLLFLPTTLTQNIVILVDLSKILPIFAIFAIKVSKILPT